MPNEGAYLGSVRSFDCLRGRCVIDSAEDGGCWHLRTAYGRPIPAGKTPKVWVFQRGSEPAIRAMWRYTHGDREIPPGVVVYRKCKTHDCVNPKHLAVGERGARILPEHSYEDARAMVWRWWLVDHPPIEADTQETPAT